MLPCPCCRQIPYRVLYMSLLQSIYTIYQVNREEVTSAQQSFTYIKIAVTSISAIAVSLMKITFLRWLHFLEPLNIPASLLWFTTPAVALTDADLVCMACLLYCSTHLSIVVCFFLQCHNTLISQPVLAGSFCANCFKEHLWSCSFAL